MSEPATISVTSKFNLPPLATVLHLPKTLGGVSATAMTGVLFKGSNDIAKLIVDLRDHEWRDAAELTVEDGLYIAGVAGVPGAALAATIVPYIFDSINIAVDSRGRPTAARFITELLHAQTNLDQIAVDLCRHDWSDAANLTLDDVLDAAETFGAGPAAVLAKATINLGFAIAKSGGVPVAFNALFSSFDQFTQDAKALPGVVVGELHGEYSKSPDGRYEFNPLKGWLLVK